MMLIALNLGLLAGLAMVSWSASADAWQNGRARGKYLAVSGGAPGATGDVVWIVDTVNQQMIALSWDPNTKAMVGVGFRDLTIDAGTALRGGGR
jgi:hypothetical protein